MITSKRINQLNELLKRTVGEIIQKDFDMPQDALITVTRVQTAKNKIRSKIFISVIPQEKEGEIIASLKKYVYYIQQGVNKKLKIRPVPKIIFVTEKDIDKAIKIEELLTQIEEEDGLVAK